jgi:hypothetical protein
VVPPVLDPCAVTARPNMLKKVRRAIYEQALLQSGPNAQDVRDAIVEVGEKYAILDTESAAWKRIIARKKAREASEWNTGPQVTVSNLASYLASQASRVAGKPDASIVALRVLSCHGNMHQGGDVPPCPAREYHTTYQAHFCTECGCGHKKSARLSEPGSMMDNPLFVPNGTTKLEVFKYLRCPRQMPGFSNAK